LKLTVDQVFPRKRRTDSIEPSIYKVSGYSDYENMWEYLHRIGIVKNPENYRSTASTLVRLQQITIPSQPNNTLKDEPIKTESKEECNDNTAKEVKY